MAPDLPVEVEWQFDAADLAPVTAWLDSALLPGYVVALASDRLMTDRYFDTPDWRLHRSGFTARLRALEGGSKLTLKSMGAATGGLRRRTEFEESLPAGAGLEAAVAAPGPAGQRIRLAGGSAWRDLFTVRTARRAYLVSDEAGLCAEVAVDRSEFFPVPDGPVAGALNRVEVELVAGGTEDRVRRFLDVLVLIGRLEPAGVSKFETGMTAAGLAGPAGFAFGSTDVSAGQSAADVAFAIFRKHFRVFLENEPGTRLGEDIEALHDMRVAARRLRAAMAAFAPYLSPMVLRYREPLGWVGQVLGEVRDLDVHLEEFAEYREHLEAETAAGLLEIEAVLAADRERARVRMLRALDSGRYARLVEGFGRTLERGPARTYPPGHVPVVLAGPRLLRARYRSVRRLGDTITPASEPAEYHALRIRAKKLRYALEFLGPVYGRPALDFSARVTALQDLLGRHQDLEVAATTLREVAARRGRRLSPEALIAVGILAERNRQEGAALRREFPALYRQLTGASWRAVRKAWAGAAVGTGA